MIGDAFVIDAVLHGFDFRPETVRVAPGVVHTTLHLALQPRDSTYDRYVIKDRKHYEHKFSPEEVVSCVFAESQTDMGVYHHVRRLGADDDGVSSEISPLEVGLEARRLAPGRILIYGALTDPFDTERSLEEIDQLVTEHGIVGLKFYPVDWDSRRKQLSTWLLDDRQLAFPLIERALDRGLKVIAVHKGMGATMRAFGVADMEGACLAFPDMNFELVHAGWAFMEDTVFLAKLPNLYLNLENTSSYLNVAPRRFGEILGAFLVPGWLQPNAGDRIVWATGAVAFHPQPLLEQFWNYSMPRDLVEGNGFPPLTNELKRKILGENFARMHGLALQDLAAGIPLDDMRRRQLGNELAEPWSEIGRSVDQC